MATLRFVRSVWESFRANSGLEPRLLDNLRVTAAHPGIVNFELDIQKEHTIVLLTKEQNRLGILHGGAIASMVDLGGSLAVASQGLFATGVSTDLSGISVPPKVQNIPNYLVVDPADTILCMWEIVTYLISGGKVGDILRAEVTCDKFGKTLAYTSIRFTNTSDELVARGSHTKYIAIAWKDERNRINQLQQEKPSGS